MTSGLKCGFLVKRKVYVNSELSDIVPGKTLSINYRVFGQNTVEVFAVDSNGNKSAAGTATIVF